MPPRRAPLYGQAIVGPPGSGKTTYCNGMQQYLRLIGRNAWVVNLDPANERVTRPPTVAPPAQQQHQQATGDNNNNNKDEKKMLPYETILNVCDDIVNLSSVMKETGLGPNGGLVYCMEYLETHAAALVATLEERVEQLRQHYNANNNTDAAAAAYSSHNQIYLLFDLPGQVEVYTHSRCVQSLLHQFVQRLDLRLTAVQLYDAQYTTDASKFLGAALLGTTTLLRLELPTVSVLSKVDLLAHESYYGGSETALDMPLEFYTECFELERLVPFIDEVNKASRHRDDAEQWNDDDDDDDQDDEEYVQALRKRQTSKSWTKFRRLHQALAEVVDDFGLLNFVPLDISDAVSVGRVVAKIDKANGFAFTQLMESNAAAHVLNCAVQQDSDYDAIQEVKERILSKK